ncbi:hypothetical protein [Falsarthrobacter nasiphocae]|uniref:Uncharacterized protein n=1 Tax=Falsarthrobacter nasiphocae TaxID=189863 RepID=A0AAE3YGX8_9MICC|nr:hypothetical protein [Falsarthrobacter nasiphocae]MDR6891791.1 hypothetical protein [Falsarthrobacter nasiphocae]
MAAPITRRRVAQYAAWTAPAVVAIAAAPGAAASPITSSPLCGQSISFTSDWAQITEISGSHTPGPSGAYYIQNYGEGASYGSWDSGADPAYRAFSAYHLDSLSYSVTYPAVEAVAGQALTFTFPLTVGYANGDPQNAMEQRLDIDIDGTTVFKASTRLIPYSSSQYFPTSSAYRTVGTGAVTAEGRTSLPAGTTSWSFTWTAPSTGTFPMTFTFWKATNTGPYDRTSHVHDAPSTTAPTDVIGTDKLSVGALAVSCA